MAPIVSVHNVIPMMGSIYADIGETMTITCQKRPYEKCEVKFSRRGWFGREYYKLEGTAFQEITGKPNKVYFEIKGNWNDKVTLTDTTTKQSAVIF